VTARGAVFVGNDVVDLANPRTQGRASDARFLARVFTADEQAAIHATGGSDVELWSRWAAKEAGFKSLSKVIGAQPAFLHRAFEVVWSDAAEPGDDVIAGAGPEGVVVRVGTVRHADHVAQVSVRMRPGAVDALAVCTAAGRADGIDIHRRVERLLDPAGCWSGPLEELMPRFSEREADAVRTLESAAVRLGARADVARMLGVTEERVEIVCAPGPSSRRPPRVLLDGCGAAADISLSHDGGWIAWAIWVGA
jgi:phosphopantetheine--protein transferase-like protein